MADTDPDEARRVTRGDCIPLALHVHVVDDGGGGDHPQRRIKYAVGGCRYSPQFARWIGREKPKSVAEREAEDRLTCWEWWKLDYLAAKVERAFGPRVHNALYAVLAGMATRAEAATAAQASVRWIGRQERVVARWVRERFDLPGRIGQDPEHAYRWDCGCHGCLAERKRDQMRAVTVGETAATGGYTGSGLYETSDVA